MPRINGLKNSFGWKHRRNFTPSLPLFNFRAPLNLAVEGRWPNISYVSSWIVYLPAKRTECLPRLVSIIKYNFHWSPAMFHVNRDKRFLFDESNDSLKRIYLVSREFVHLLHDVFLLCWNESNNNNTLRIKIWFFIFRDK